MTNPRAITQTDGRDLILTCIIDLGCKTRYTATVHHWSIADREAHEAMGFHQGWPIASEQLAALVEPA